MTHAAVIAPREAQLVGQVLHDVIRVEREGAVVTLTIDHPPANAVNGDVVNGLTEGLAHAEADETCRALVITGNGPKFFSAGADIAGFGAGAEAMPKRVTPARRRLASCPGERFHNSKVAPKLRVPAAIFSTATSGP